MEKEFMRVIKAIERENFNPNASIYNYVTGKMIKYLSMHTNKSLLKNLYKLKSNKSTYKIGKKDALKLYKENKDIIERHAIKASDMEDLEHYLMVSSDIGLNQPYEMIDEALKHLVYNIYLYVKVDGTFFKDLI